MKKIKVEIICCNGYEVTSKALIDAFDSWEEADKRDKQFAGIASALHDYTYEHEGYMPTLVATEQDGEKQVQWIMVPCTQSDHKFCWSPMTDFDGLPPEKSEVPKGVPFEA